MRMKTSTAFYLALLFLVLIYLEHRLVTSTFDTLRPSSHRPPLTDLVQNGMIVGDVQDLCDFIIAGHPKTGTTSLLAWFANNPEITMYDREIRVLRESAAELAELMYELPDGEGKKAGYKAPNDIRWPNALTAIKQFWPKTKLIVGVRHPVLWFQSWYNFKGRQGKMTLQPLDYTGGKLNDQVKYANNLAQLGKTPMTSQERALLVGNVTVIGLPNKVFLYDIAQVGDKNATRSARFRRDLAEFVGIKELSPDVPHNGYDVDPPGFVPIDICHYKYRPIRAELMEVARGASVWIREYFLKSPDVIVSSREFLEEQLLTWMEDPCEQTIDFGTDY